MIGIAILLIIVAIGLFLGYKKLHEYLDNEWEKNPIVPTPNGNGKNLSLHTINGIGFSFHGQYRHAMLGEHASYATYYTFCFFFVPIISIRCYRVIPSAGDGYYILGSEKTDFRELACLLMSILRWVAAVAAVIACFSAITN